MKKGYCWGIIDPFWHLKNTEISSDFGTTSIISSDQKPVILIFCSQEAAAYSRILMQIM